MNAERQIVGSILGEIEYLTTEVESLLSDGELENALLVFEKRDEKMRELFLEHNEDLFNYYFPTYLKCVADNKYLREQVIEQKKKSHALCGQLAKMSHYLI